MRRNDLLNLLFNPQVPLLFVLGSVVLALLGNAVYDFAITLLGASLLSYAGLILVTGLLFIVLSNWFRELLRAVARRAPPVVKLPDEERSDPQPALVMLVGVGPRERGPEWPVLEWHMRDSTLRRCWLVVSPEGKQFAEDLRYELHARNVRAEIVEIAGANQAVSAHQAVLQAVGEARIRYEDRIAVDITGGTKPMSAGAALACLEAEVVLEYLVTVRKPTGEVELTARPEPMRLQLKGAQKGN